MRMDSIILDTEKKYIVIYFDGIAPQQGRKGFWLLISGGGV